MTKSGRASARPTAPRTTTRRAPGRDDAVMTDVSVEIADVVPMGRRALTKETNRAAILAAGQRVFGSLGYDACGIRDIVRESGLSPGTFYNYFDDKESVFAVLVDEVIGRLRPKLAEARARASGLDAFLLDAFRAAVGTFVEDVAMLAILQRSARAFREHLHGGAQLGGLYAELCRDLRRGQERGYLPALPVELVASSMVGATVELCVELARTTEGRSVRAEATAQYLAALFAGGLPNVAARVGPTRKRKRNAQD